MNWPNRLTLGRLALTVIFVCSLSSNWAYGRTIALILFVLAGISDYFDGEIARRYGIVTKFGKLMDPLVDNPPPVHRYEPGGITTPGWISKGASRCSKVGM